MTRRKITETIARSSSFDEGMRSMKKAGRTKWSIEDYNIAVKKYNKLWK